MGSYTDNAVVDDATMERIVDTLIECLDDTGARISMTTVFTLGGLAEPSRAKAALPALRSLLVKKDERMKPRIEKAIKAIESGEPEKLQLTDIKSQLEEAQELNEELTDRVDKLEAMMSALSGDEETASGKSDSPGTSTGSKK
jgi:hypothetical protein